jgi:hypothetical protein
VPPEVRPAQTATLGSDAHDTARAWLVTWASLDAARLCPVRPGLRRMMRSSSTAVVRIAWSRRVNEHQDQAGEHGQARAA